MNASTETLCDGAAVRVNDDSPAPEDRRSFHRDRLYESSASAHGFRLIAAVAMAAFFAAVSMAGMHETKNSRKKGVGETMFRTDQIEYPVRDANYQKNSCVTAVCKTAGKLKWKKAYAEIDPLMTPYVHTILCHRDYLGVVSNEHLLMFDTNGKFKFMVPVALHTPVIFGKEAFACVDRAFFMEYHRYGNEKILEHKGIQLDEWSKLRFLLPAEHTVTAAFQFDGRPQGLPREFTLFHGPIEKRYPTWDLTRPGVVPDPVLLTKNESTILINERNRCTVVDLKTGAQSAFSPAAVDNIMSMSISPDDELVMVGTAEGEGGKKSFVAVCDLTGKQLWSYVLDSLKVFQPPVCGPHQRVYIIDRGELLCLEKGALIWQLPVVTGLNVLMTVTSRNQVLCLNGPFLTCIDENGKVVFNELLSPDPNSGFNAPPVIDAQGRVYCSSSQVLYCFE